MTPQRCDITLYNEARFRVVNSQSEIAWLAVRAITINDITRNAIT